MDLGRSCYHRPSGKRAGMDSPGIFSLPRAFNQDVSHTYLHLENCSRLSERTWFCVSGSRKEKHKAAIHAKKQRKMDRMFGSWLMTVKVKMAPPDEARDASPRPVDLKSGGESLSGGLLRPTDQVG